MNFDETLKYWQDMFAEVEHRLARNDRRMVEEHARRTDLAAQDVRYMFS